jgi:hypothetical protein
MPEKTAASFELQAASLKQRQAASFELQARLPYINIFLT